MVGYASREDPLERRGDARGQMSQPEASRLLTGWEDRRIWVRSRVVFLGTPYFRSYSQTFGLQWNIGLVRTFAVITMYFSTM